MLPSFFVFFYILIASCVVANGQQLYPACVKATLNDEPLQASITGMAYNAEKDIIYAISGFFDIFEIDAKSLKATHVNIQIDLRDAGSAPSFINAIEYDPFQKILLVSSTPIEYQYFSSETVYMFNATDYSFITLLNFPVLIPGYLIFDPSHTRLFQILVNDNYLGSGMFIREYSYANATFTAGIRGTFTQPHVIRTGGSNGGSLFFFADWSSILALINYDEFTGSYTVNPGYFYFEIINGPPSTNLPDQFISDHNFNFQSFLNDQYRYMYAVYSSSGNQSSAVLQYDSQQMSWGNHSVQPASMLLFFDVPDIHLVAIDNVTQTMFLATDTGRIYQTTYNQTNRYIVQNWPPYNLNASLIDPTYPTLTSQYFDLPNKRVFYASSDAAGSVWMVPFGACGSYTDCNSCVAAGVYCGWCYSSGQCTNDKQCDSTWNNISCPVIYSVQPFIISTWVINLVHIQTSPFPDSMVQNLSAWSCSVTDSTSAVISVAPVVNISESSVFSCPLTPVLGPLVNSTFDEVVYLHLQYSQPPVTMFPTNMPLILYDCQSQTSCVTCYAASTSTFPCGWCLGQNLCTQHMFCNTTQTDVWISPLQPSTTCPTFTMQVSPNFIAFGDAGSIDLLAEGIPVLGDTDYNCSFGDQWFSQSSSVSADVGGDTKITCPVPSAVSGPGIFLNTSLSIYYNNIQFLPPSNLSMITFFNCSFATTCESCNGLFGGLYCNFDFTANQCQPLFEIPDEPTPCPVLTGLSHTVLSAFPSETFVISGQHLPPAGTYTCIYQLDWIVDVRNGTYLDANSLSCDTPTAFVNPISGFTTDIQLSVVRSGLPIVPLPSFTLMDNLTFVTCLTFSDSCARCLQDTDGICIWCNSSTTCIPPAVSSGCSSLITDPVQCTAPAPGCLNWSPDQATVCNFLLSSQTPQSPFNYSNIYNPCSWNTSYIGCDMSGAILDISLPSSALAGTLPTSLMQLNQLQSLDLSGNGFQGSIPEDWNLSHLTNLVLAFNQLNGTIPTMISNSPLLSYIRLAGNQFSGRLDTSFLFLNRLLFLDISSNRFTGTIPRSLIDVGIQFLDLHDNLITGTVPDSSAWSPMQLLDLSDNGFSGTLPCTFYGFYQLTLLNMSHNQFSGSWSRQILSQSNNLVLFDISNNLFNSDIRFVFPIQFPLIQQFNIAQNLFFGSIFVFFDPLQSPELAFLNLSSNALDGTIPTQLFDIQFNGSTFLLDNNRFSGPTDMLMNQIQTSFTSGDLIVFLGNTLDCPLASYPGAFRLLNNSGDEIFPWCVNISVACDYWGGDRAVVCQFLVDNMIGSYDPAIDPCQWENGAHVQCASDYTTVINIDLSSMGLFGTIPSDFGTLTSLQSLILANNTLNGTIPSELGFIGTSLISLDLSINNLNGSIPDTIANLNSLNTLNLHANMLEGDIDTWLPTLSLLQDIDLSNNAFSGTIPEDLATLRGASSLNLSKNQLVSTIPPGLGIFSEIDLSFNMLNGTIPSDIGMAESLHLSNNLLSGTIPYMWVDSVTNLRELDLSHNQLGGTIPEFLGSGGYLNTLLLMHNNLNGSIPSNLLLGDSMFFLNLSYNQLTGPFDAAFKRVRPEAQYVWDLSHNLIADTFSDVFYFFSFFSLLDVSYNSFHGPLPVGLGASVFDYFMINLSHNQFNGSVPASYFPLGWNGSIVHLDHNNLSGYSDGFMAPLDLLSSGTFTVFEGNSISCPILSYPQAALLLNASGDILADCVPIPPFCASSSLLISMCSSCTSTVSIAEGQSLTWTVGPDSGNFSVTFPFVDSGLLTPNQSFTYTFNASGVFDYYSKYDYFRGRVRVGQTPLSAGNNLTLNLFSAIFIAVFFSILL